MAMAQTAFRTRPSYYRHDMAAARRLQRAEMPLFQAFLRPSPIKVTDGLCIKDSVFINRAMGCAGILIDMIELTGLRRWESPCTRHFERVEAMAPPPCSLL